jgi:ubiquinone/menaquinone biosynthesis C-methylase UbiE
MVVKGKSWWSEEYGFFGIFYMEGDDSKEGYLAKTKQNLKERTLTEVDGCIRLLSTKPLAKILDCPCGYGRHSTELAKRGFEVTGSDINFFHLADAKLVAIKEHVNVSFVKENMLDLKYSEEFDAVVNLFHSFGFFDSDEDNEKALANFFRALKRGGKLIIHTDVNVPRVLSGKYKFNERRVLSSGRSLIIDETYDDAKKRMFGSWAIRDNQGKEKIKRYSVRVYTKDEFVELCRKVGFKECRVFSDWNGSPYSEKSECMIILAIK